MAFFRHTNIEEAQLLNSVVLLVDDTRFNIQLLEEIMKVRGFRNVITAMNGQEALELYHSHKPDLAVLDLMMPVMNGYEFCKAIRQDIGDKDFPILVQTALTSLKERQAAFDAGASDLVSKPVNPEELISRVKVHLSLRSMVKDLSHYREMMQQEMVSAQNMQAQLLPSNEDIRLLAQNSCLTIEHHFEPSLEIGGDIWGVFSVGEGKVAVYVTDFSGHGVTAAINTFRFHTILMRLTVLDKPSEVMQALNAELYAMLPTERFATMFYGVFDHNECTFTYATASSPTMFYRSGVELTPLKSTGFGLGVKADATYEDTIIPVKEKDSLILYSDALIETSNTHGEFFDEEKVQAFIRRQMDEQLDAAQMLEALLGEFKEYQGSRKQPDDDLTLLSISCGSHCG